MDVRYTVFWSRTALFKARITKANRESYRSLVPDRLRLVQLSGMILYAAMVVFGALC